MKIFNLFTHKSNAHTGFKKLPAQMLLGMTLSLGFISHAAIAADDTGIQQKFVDSDVNPYAFLREAISVGETTLALSEMALDVSTETEVRHLAKVIIDERTLLNRHLREIATVEGVRIDKDAKKDKTKDKILKKHQQGESFDVAYADYLVKSHRESLKLFRQAANSDNDDVRNFAEAAIGTVEHHLNLSQTLAETLSKVQAREVPEEYNAP